MQIGMQVKSMFFDRKAVMKRVNRATRRVLSRFGAFVRTAAKSSIRRRKKSSEPGRPPSSHSGDLKRLIYFGYDPKRETVVIGPLRLNQKIGNAPEALEHGGVSVVAEGSRRRRKRRRRKVMVQARPFMGPAMERETPKLPRMWADSVR